MNSVRFGWLILASCLATSLLSAAPQRGAPLAQTAAPAVRDVKVAAIPGVVGEGVAWKVVWQGTDNADGLVGLADGSLLFAQEQPNRVRRIAPDGTVSVHVEDTHGAGSLAVDAAGRILAVQRTCTDPGRQGPPCTEPTAIAIIHPPAARRTLATAYQGKPLGRINDLVVDKMGGVYFTSGGAYYVNPRREVSMFGDGLRTNGIMLSRDERTLYVTNGPAIAAFDVQPDGPPRNQREFATLMAGGNGDGLAIDDDGRLYVTSGPGVQVFSENGAYLGLIPTPRSVISAAFAGPGKRTLFVVGSGALNADGTEATTPSGVRNNAKTIYSLPMLAAGFGGREK